MKLRRNRVLALVMVFAMLLGLLPVSAMAATDTGSHDQIEYIGGTENPAYYTVGADGALTDPSNNSLVETVEGRVSVTETIKETSTKNLFKLDLTVTLKDSELTQVTTADSAVVLVIDVSGSMEWCIQCGQGTHDSSVGHDFQNRLAYAKTAAARFLESYAKNADGAKRMVSIVAYRSYAEVVSGWVDAAKFSNWSDNNPLIAEINKLEAPNDYYGGTNTEEGLSYAKKQLEDLNKKASDSGISNTSVVLLTDGEPTTQTNGDCTNTTSEEQRTYFLRWFLSAMSRGREITQTGAKLYSVCYGYNSAPGFFDRETWLRTFSTATYPAYNADQLQISLDNILKQMKLSADAWKVEVPFGPYIVFDETQNSNANRLKAGIYSFNSEANTLTWNLRADKSEVSNGVTTYQSVITVKLNTAAKGFDETAWYRTNGLTKLSYVFTGEGGVLTDEAGNNIYNADGSVNADSDGKTGMRTLAFRVPQVKGAVPEVPYTINYWKLDKDENRAEKATDTQSGTGKLWTTVNPVENYETRYKNYTLISTNTSLELTSETENVLDIEYMPQTTNVTVKHYYKDITIAADGTSSETSYGDPVVKTDGIDGNEGNLNPKLYVGEKYTVGDEGNLGLITTGGYTVDSTSLPDDSKTLTLDKTGNVIEIYYSRTVDNSLYDMKVTHTYKTYQWQPDPDKNSDTFGKLVKTQVGEGVEVTISEDNDLKMSENPGKTQSTPLTPKQGNENFVFVEATSTSDKDVLVNQDEKTATVDIKVGANDLNLIFEYVPEKPDNTTITVNHYYTNDVTAIVDGKVSTDGSFTELGETEKITDYAPNETYRIAEKTTYKDQDYKPDAGNAEKLSGTVVDGQTIDLYYTRTESPKPGTLTVNHVFRSWEKYTLEDGESFDYREIPSGHEPVVVKYPAEGTTLYEGQEVSVSLVEAPSGFHFTTDGSDIGAAGENISAGAADADKTITVYYDSHPEDNREDGEVTIVHHYATIMDVVINGKVELDYWVEEGSASESIEDKAGESYDITEETTYKVESGLSAGEHSDYVCVTTHAATGTLHSGTNKTIDLYYEREENKLGDQLDYTVNYEYYEQTMEFDANNQPVWGDPVPVTPAGVPATVNGKAYATEKITLTTGAGTYDGVEYQAMSGQIAMEQTITESGVTFTLKYLHQTPKDAATVRVEHHYTTITIDKFGVPGAPVTTDSGETTYHVFVGEAKTVDAIITAPYGYSDVKIDGGTLADAGAYASQNEETKAVTVIANANSPKVDFYYSRTIDNSEGNEATWTISHHYRTIDWNENDAKEYDPIGTGKSYSQSGSAFGEQQLDGTPNLWMDESGNPTYQLDTAETSGDFLPDSYSITMAPGENTIDFYYTNHVDTRDEITLLVKHVYTSTDTFRTKDYDDATDVVPVPAKIDGNWNIWVGKDFAAKLETARTTGEGETQTTTVYNFVSATYSDKNTSEENPATALDKDETNDGYLTSIRLTNLEDQTITATYHRDFSSSTSVTVNHYYNTYDTRTGETTSNTASAEVVTETGESNAAIYVGNTYTPAEFAKDGYVRQTGLNGIMLAEGQNVIDIIYLRTVSSDSGGPSTPDKPDPERPDPEKPDKPDPEKPVDPVKPGVPEDEVVINEEETPLGNLPVEENPPAMPPEAVDEFIIVEEQLPLGNLPQTGSKAHSQSHALGFMGLFSLTAAAGLLAMSRKKENKD